MSANAGAKSEKVDRLYGFSSSILTLARFHIDPAIPQDGKALQTTVGSILMWRSGAKNSALSSCWALRARRPPHGQPRRCFQKNAMI
jgi:hypothetical protein